MKLLTAQQIRDWDAFTIKHEPITSIDLMERAAQVFVRKFVEVYHGNKPVKIYCGLGNNGGDGLAIARLLLNEGIHAEVFIVNYSLNRSPDFKTNEARLREQGKAKMTYLDANSVFEAIGTNDIIIDALFGTGLNSSLEGLVLKVVQHINHYSSLTISVDIPSGLPADVFSLEALDFDRIIHAHYTFTFQVPKLSFLHAETAACVGEFYILDIQLHEAYLNKLHANKYFITSQDLPYIKNRVKFSHKGMYGHALCIGGSYGKIGASILMSQACLRTGAGLVTSFLPKVGYTILQSAFPEGMVITDDELYEIRNFPDIKEYSAVGIGPGMGMNEYTIKSFYKWLPTVKKPCVIDADALNICAKLLQEHHDSFWLPKQAIITPHPKEFDRLAGASKTSEERIEKQLRFAEKHQVYVVLKGAHTSIATPNGKLYFNSTGNAGMATAGSGDVLTGMITALLAQHYSPEEAAILGVYLHGVAGDIAASELGQEGLIASDIIHAISFALQEIKGLNA